MDGFAPIRLATEVSTPRPSPEDAVAVVPVEKRDARNAANEPEAQPRIPEPPPSSFKARLNYDRERAEVYVEILDPQTGDVIQTLPPDQAAEEYAPLRESGSLLDALA